MSKKSNRPAAFDRFAEGASSIASRAPYFAFCVALIVIWFPSIVFMPVDTWQLVINTATTIITFLMVALLQNTQTRNDEATQDKLNAVSDALARFMAHAAEKDDSDDLKRAIKELRDAVGLEKRETTH